MMTWPSKNRQFCRLAFAISVAVCGRAHAGELVLVQDGKGRCTIVADANLSPSEKWAVGELKAHIKEMSGAEVPVVAPERAPEEGALILIGNRTVKGKHPEIALDDLGKEGYVIKTTGRELLIAGGEKRGTMYGVFTFLESLGCHWWTPTESTIPKRNTLAVATVDLRQVPRLEYRDMLYNERSMSGWYKWCARNKVNGTGWQEKMPEEMGGRYSWRPDSLVHTWWAVLAEGGMKGTGPQPCLTSPEVIAAMTKGAIKIYKDHPDIEFVVLGPQDNNNYCRCQACSALTEKEGSVAGPALVLANKVAEALEKEVPGARVLCAAYSGTQTPPKTIRPRSNVMIITCPIRCDFAHPIATGGDPDNQKFRKDFEAWSEISSKVFLWHYSGNRGHYLMPNPDLDSLVANVRYFADHKASGVFVQGTHNGRASDLVQLHMWLLGKLLWNPDANGPALMAEFANGYYGPAGEPILKYINLLHEPARSQEFSLKRRSQMHLPFVRPEILAEGEVLLREAERLVKGSPDLERRVRHAHMPIWYMLVKRGPDSPTWKAVQAKAGKLDLRDVASSLLQVIRENGINTVADYEPIEPFVEWLKEYPKLLAEKGRVTPPELEGVDPNTYRLLQSRQLDSGTLKPGWWHKMDGDSDGWSLQCSETSAFYGQHRFNRWDEFTPGKTYSLFIRVKGSEKKADGPALRVNVAGLRKEFAADQLADGKFHAFEVGEFTAPEDFSVSWSRVGKAMDRVFIDCLWLREAK